METYVAKKHWWFWVPYITLSILFIWTLIIPIWLILWAFFRWKLDKIEIKDGCLCSRLGIIIIDKKTIPLEKISFVSEKQDIISEMLGFACVQIQSSADSNAIIYPCIANSAEFVKKINELKA
jgi:membrane protein YdbS with pleckstrin-like domain